MYINFRLLKCSIGLVICISSGLFFNTACQSSHTDKDIGNTMNANESIIFANTQLTFEVIRIGIGNIREEEYIDDQGSEEVGLTAGLWIYHRDDASLNQQVRVYPGQELDTGDYHITVYEINKDTKSFVRLLITKKE